MGGIVCNIHMPNHAKHSRLSLVGTRAAGVEISQTFQGKRFGC